MYLSALEGKTLGCAFVARFSRRGYVDRDGATAITLRRGSFDALERDEAGIQSGSRDGSSIKLAFAHTARFFIQRKLVKAPYSNVSPSRSAYMPRVGRGEKDATHK